MNGMSSTLFSWKQQHPKSLEEIVFANVHLKLSEIDDVVL